MIIGTIMCFNALLQCLIILIEYSFKAVVFIFDLIYKFVKYIQNTVIYTRNQLPASITNVYSNVTRALHVKLPEAHNALILISRTHNKNQTVHVLENWDPNPNGPLSVDQAPLNTDFWFFDDGFNPDPPS